MSISAEWIVVLSVFLVLPLGGVVAGLAASAAGKQRRLRAAAGHLGSGGQLTSEGQGGGPNGLITGFEAIVGRHWMTWLGVGALFIASVFFVKFAMDHGFFGPTARVVCGGVFGLTLIVFGERFSARSMRTLGVGLTSGGLSIVYAAVASSHVLYELISAYAAFGLLAVSAAAGFFLAVRRNALAISLVSTLSGFLIPLLLWNSMNEAAVLFPYILVLDTTVLAVAFARSWRGLDLTAFGCTWLLYAIWAANAGSSLDSLVGQIPWLASFFALFLLVPSVNHLRKKSLFRPERIVLAAASGVAAFCFALILATSNDRQILGLFGIGFSLAYALLAFAVRRKIPNEVVATTIFAVISIAWFLIGAPILFKIHVLSVALAVFASALLAVGFKGRVRWLRLVGLSIFGLTSLKLLLMDLAGLDEGYRIASFAVVGVLAVGASYVYNVRPNKLDAKKRA